MRNLVLISVLASALLSACGSDQSGPSHQSASSAPTTVPVTVDAAKSDAASLAKGRELTKLYLAGETATIWAQMDLDLQRFIKSEAAFGQFRTRAQSEIGSETDVLSETVQQEVGFVIYERTSRWSTVKAPYVMRWEFTAEGKIVGFGISDKVAPPEPAPTSHLDYITKAALHLPFKGEWTVFWGGRSVQQNLHIVQQQQRFAYDFSIARDGRTHSGNGTKVEEYYCWGVPILAPAAGTVVSVVKDIPDQPIDGMDKTNLAGNYIILDLGQGEYALLAHLRNKSVRVKAGDIVKVGDDLGQCGNSGNTSQPHLHFHVQNSPKFGKGDGLPAFFLDYVADGKPVARGEPVKGQIISSR